MSYTLKKLKQSEVDHGYRKPIRNKKRSTPYGFFISCFVITLSLILTVIYQIQDHQNTAVSPVASKSFMPKQVINVKPIEVPKIKQQQKKQARVKPSEKAIIASFEKDYSSLKKKNKIPTHGQAKIVSIEKQANLNNEKIGLLPSQPVLFRELPKSVQKSLPKINLNGIAFFRKKEDRFVFINMAKHRIDDVLEEGLSIEAIRRDSVIMRHQNRRFILTVHK